VIGMGTTVVFDGLTKRFGDREVVKDLSATVRPGRVTGFLGPNGAGKTTSLRMLLGLVRPTSGGATFDGRAYADLPHPMREVGTLLEATGFHPGRRARDHLRVLATAAELDQARVDVVLDQVGLTEAGGRKVGQYSLGMRQRLGLGAALLGDPAVLVLDEPANGLDPFGIRWLRGLLRQLAAEGRTVLVSSHLLQEVEQTADDVLVLSQGVLVRSGPMTELQAGQATVVRSPDAVRLLEALREQGLSAEPDDAGGLQVAAPPPRVGQVAAGAGVVLHHLAPSGGLEELFFRLTADQDDSPALAGDAA
jgi:ABC-2 type transport system ATP-binding protein